MSIELEFLIAGIVALDILFFLFSFILVLSCFWALCPLRENVEFQDSVADRHTLEYSNDCHRENIHTNYEYNTMELVEVTPQQGKKDVQRKNESIFQV